MEFFKNKLETVTQLNLILEVIFKNHFFANTQNKFDAQYKGQLSTNSKDVGDKITKEEIAGKCIVFCNELIKCLNYFGIYAIKISNNKPKNHEYLIVELSNGTQIIIDPTIVQWIGNHRNVFVGTKLELQTVIIDYIKSENLNLTNQEILEKAQQFYNEIYI